jgi:archaemetzincin
MRGEIVIAPVGEVDERVLAHLSLEVGRRLARPCQVGPGLPAPEEAFDPRRRQYAAEAILQQLHPGDAERVLGVVDVDLYVSALNFVFGVADTAGRRAVIALPRLREGFYGAPDNEALFHERAVKEAVHELGHTYGLRHCNNRRCVMAFSNSLADTDYKAAEFCQRCQRMLRL